MTYQTYKTFDFNTPWHEQRKKRKALGWTNDELAEYKRQRDHEQKLRAQNRRNVEGLRQKQARVLKPLQTECRIAVSQMYYWDEERSPEHHAFYAAYSRALRAVYDRLVWDFAKFQESPAEIAQRFNVPNKGEHWTDWVDWVGETSDPPVMDWTDKIKRRYAKLTFKAGRKRKAILARWTSDSHAEAVKKLLARTKGEFDSLQRECLVAPSKDKEETLKRIATALDLIARLSIEDNVPKTWHGFFEEAEQDNDNWGEQ